MKILKVAVIGTGIIGKGITQICAQSGYETILRGRNIESIRTSIDAIRSVLSRRIEKGKITAKEQEEILARIKGVINLSDLLDSDLVIEAIIEDLSEKKNLFSTLDEICPKNTILTSTTSSLSITTLAAITHGPERVLGTHFFDPAYLTKTVEIITTCFSSEEVVQAVKNFLSSLGKKSIVCRDTPGFVVNRIWIPFVLEAMRTLEAGIASKEDIDEGISFALQHPWGPLTVADAAGLDTIYRVASAMYEELKDPKYAPPPLLARMVAAGFHGRKSGRGFYNYG